MKIELIKSPSAGTLTILARRSADGGALLPNWPGAVGLIQGSLAEIITAADLAEKAAEVHIEEIRGSCPQHITLIAVFGDIAAVEFALKAVAEYFHDRQG